jgi:hypothetical protein
VNPRHYDYLVKGEISLVVNGVLTAVRSAKDLENRNWEPLVDAGIMIEPSFAFSFSRSPSFQCKTKKK